jgi:hypothetical protein
MVVAEVTGLLSVVVDELDIFSAGVGPVETDSPLLVHPDAVRPGTVALQLLESVAGGNPQIAENLGSIKNQQLPEDNSLRAVVESTDSLSLPDPLGLLVSERPDHISDNNG